MFNIIGDIAGQFKTLQTLLKKMPEGTPVSVGDMVDRGPQSDEVIQFFVENGRAVLGNHEHLMLDFVEETNIYDSGVWFWNGGTATARSYIQRKFGGKKDTATPEEIREAIDENHVKWLKSLPLYIENDDEWGKIVITHAPINPVFGLERAVELVKGPFGGDNSVIWNRGNPRDMAGVNLQIHGHNARNGVDWFGKPPYAVCIDTSRARVLTGIHWPTMEIFQQEYLEDGN